MLPKIIPVLPGKKPADAKAVITDPFSYLYEQKLDGWRCLAYAENQTVVLDTKRGLTHRGFTEIKTELRSLGFGQAVFDGEILCLDQKGNPDFRAMMRRSSAVYYFMFDVLYLNGTDVRSLPFVERKGILRRVLQNSRDPLRYVEHFEANEARSLVAKIQTGDLEGIVAKLRSGPYDPALLANWVKLKNKNYSQDIGRWKWFA